MDTLVFDVGLAHKLKKAFAREGWTEKEIDDLCGGDNLHNALLLQRGLATIKLKYAMIDMNAFPSGIVAAGQRGWSLVEHAVTGPRNTGFLDWNPENVALYPMQRLSVRQFLAQLSFPNRRHLNASVLEHLVMHDHLVPHSWRGMNILFLGTRFLNLEGEEVVRCLFYSSVGHWTWKQVSVTRQLGDDYIVAMLKI